MTKVYLQSQAQAQSVTMSSFYIGKWEDKGEPFSIPGLWEVEHSEMAPPWWPHNSTQPSWLNRRGVSCICRRGKQWEKHYSFNNNSKDFPGGPMVKILPSNAGGVDSIPGRGAKILHALPAPSPNGLEWVSLSDNQTTPGYNKHIVDFTKMPHSLSHLPRDKHTGYQILPCCIPCTLGPWMIYFYNFDYIQATTCSWNKISSWDPVLWSTGLRCKKKRVIQLVSILHTCASSISWCGVALKALFCNHFLRKILCEEVIFKTPDIFPMSSHVSKQPDYMMIFYFYLVCFAFSVSYPVLLFHLVYVFWFLSPFLDVLSPAFIKHSIKALVYI